VIDVLPEPDLPLGDRIARLNREVARHDLQQWGAGLATGLVRDDAAQHPRIEWLGGTRGWRPYWARTWGLRLLLHIGADAATVPAICAALQDESWRVREMALKVIARHDIVTDIGTTAALLDDPVARVRNQARRALDLRAP
jgi:HEAT repeat protein